MSDENGNYYNFNKRWLEFRGRRMEQEVGSSWIEGLHPDDREHYNTVFRKALISKTPFETHYRLQRADGEYRVMIVKGEPEFDCENKFSGFIGTSLDTTSISQHQAQAQRITTLLEETNAIAKVGGWEYDVISQGMIWTNEVYKIFGLDPLENLTAERVHSFYHPDFKERARQHFEDAVINGTSFNLELKGIHVKGHEIWLSIRGKAIRVNNKTEKLIGAIQDITQQKTADIALSESERKLHFVLDALPVVVYLTDANGYITNYNKTAADLWGKSVLKDAVKWSGSHKLYLSSGAFISDEECPMAVAIKQNKIIYGEELISECPQGTRTNMIVFVTPYTNVQGEVIGALNVLVDITERKQLEEKLTSLSLVARKTSNAVIISDAEGRITWVNQSFTRISGYSMAEAIGKKPEELLHCEETNKNTLKDVHKAFEKQEPIRFEILNKGKSGNKYWLDVDIQPLRDFNGNLSGFVSVETDITEIKYIHEELKKSENKLRAMLDSTSDDNILVDPDYKIISINKVAIQNLRKTYGIDPAVGQLIWEYVKDDLRPEFEQTFNQAIAGFMSKREKLLKVRGEVKMWFEFCFYPVYANDGVLIGVAINSKNIHGKKMAELRVQRQNKKLKEIAFIQSHTLRRPVANIMGLWNLINQEFKNNPEGSPDLSELLKYLGRSVNEMDDVIRNITGNTYNIDEV